MLENNIKYIREELEMTQKELGLIFGVSEYTISGWETGKDFIPLNKLVKFCNLYELNIDYIMGLKRSNDNYIKIPKLNKKNIGYNLKVWRIQSNKTQLKLSEECGCSRSTIGNYETGYSLINTITLFSICKKNNISAYTFLL